MATVSNDIDEIYHRMAVIRRELHTNVRESVAGAEAVVDWGKYTWTYPWIALGAAAAVGYLVYTGSRQRVVTETASLTDVTDGGEPLRERAAWVRNGQGPAGISCSPPGVSCSPWPSVRARITCCIGSNNNTRPGRRGRTRDSAFGRGAWRQDRAGRSGKGLSRSSGFDRNSLLGWRSGRWRTAFKA